MNPPDSALTEYLADQPVARLATVDVEGRPHVVPICFAYAHGCLYSALDSKPKRTDSGRLRRVSNIRANPNVQVLVDEYNEDWSRLRYIQLRGTAEILTAGSERDAAIQLLIAKYEQYKTMNLDGQPVIKMVVGSVVAWGRPLED